MLEVELPYPPSINHYWRRVGPKTLISREGRRFRASVVAIREQAKAAELGWRTIRRANEVLGIVPRKRTFAGGWEWALPEGGQPDAEGGQLPRRCPSSEKPGHLRENTGETGRNCLDLTEGGQVTDNLATFGQNVDDLATFDDDATSFPFGWSNPDDPDGERLTD